MLSLKVREVIFALFRFQSFQSIFRFCFFGLFGRFASWKKHLKTGQSMFEYSVNERGLSGTRSKFAN